MTGGTSLVVQNENAERNPEIQTVDNISWERIPEKRTRWRVRLASIIICLFIATLIICHGFVENETIEYEQVFDLSASKLEEIRNGSIKIYTREVKKTYPVLFNLGFGVLAIILGTFVDRLSLVAEEFFHFESRYNRKKLKMVKACLSGISWPAVGVVTGLVVICIIIPLANKAKLELRHVAYILSGIGVGPLVMHLLNLNTQSEVHISTILEEKETYVANGLAWSYYFNYLDIALPKFNEIIPNNSCNPVELKDGKVVKLSSSKLILLISHDCTTADNLAKLDDKIIKQGEISNGKYVFPVYRLRYNNRDYTYVIKYVMQPLETLEKMSQYGRIKALDEKQLEYQVKLLCRTLSEILKKPFDKECKEKCILVAIKANSKENLNNGGLVNAIMHKVRPDESTPEHVQNVFEVISPSTQKTKQSKATEDDTSEGKAVDLPPSHKVNINLDANTVQYSKQDPPITNQEKQANKLERGKEPINGTPQRKHKEESSPIEKQPLLNPNNYKETQTIPEGQTEMDDRKESGGIEETDQCTSSNLVDRKQYGGRPAISDVKPIYDHTAESGSHSTSSNSANGGRNSPREDNPPILNCTGQTENQSSSSDFVDGGESHLREEVDNGRPSRSNSNPPASDHIEENQNQPMSDGENSPGGEEQNKESMSNTSMNGGV